MPHFVIDCSENIIKQNSPELILQKVHHSAESTGLFNAEDIKVRINAFQNYYKRDSSDDFIHVFAHIMEGRTTEQKSLLSQNIVSGLKNILPDVPVISINISDFEKATYCNKSMVL